MEIEPDPTRRDCSSKSVYMSWRRRGSTTTRKPGSASNRRDCLEFDAGGSNGNTPPKVSIHSSPLSVCMTTR